MASSLEDDMCCTVCCDIYTDPVVLECSHSFCRPCLDTYWSDQVTKLCPVCRQTSLNHRPPSNLALRNIVEACVKEHGLSLKGDRGAAEGRRESVGRAGSLEESGEARCSLHGEKLLLFCTTDQEALCVVCTKAKKHRDHQMCPVEEVAEELKEEVRASLKPLREKLQSFQKVKAESMKTAEHIKRQAKQTENQIKREFEALHHFLRLEEAARIAALVDETELKTMIMTEKIEHLTRKMEALANSISGTERELEAKDISFLQTYKNQEKGATCALQDPVLVSDALIDVAKHLGNLQFRVWEKMQGKVEYSPVILDPNTAAPWLSLSEDLTSVHYSGDQPDVPDNPERCDLCVCVLGSEPFGSGTHSWEVDVGGKAKWDLGVLGESVGRKGILNVNPASGFWAMSLRGGDQYRACTQPWTRLSLSRRPQRIRVCLDYSAGQVSFYDPADMSLICAFTHSFKERLLPYFSPCVSDKGHNAEPLRICPVKVSVRGLRSFMSNPYSQILRAEAKMEEEAVCYRSNSGPNFSK